MPRALIALAALLLLLPSLCLAEIELIGKEGKLLKTKQEDFSLTSEIYERTSFVITDNLLDLDSKSEDDFKFDFDSETPSSTN